MRYCNLNVTDKKHRSVLFLYIYCLYADVLYLCNPPLLASTLDMHDVVKQEDNDDQ